MPARSFFPFASLLLLLMFSVTVPASGQGGGARSAGSHAGTPSSSQTAELSATDEQYLSSLGYSVAVSGNTVVVGAPGGSDGQGDFAPGAVYVYVKPASGWGNMTQVAELSPSDTSGADGFGISVAISGNTIAVNGDKPEIYVFVEPKGGWVNMTETAILSVSPIGLGPCLCGQVAIDGDTIAVGSPLDGLGNFGSIEVYAKPSTGWRSTSQPNATLVEADAQYEDQSFASIAMSGDTIVGIGLQIGSTAEYFVYLFVKPATGWNGDYTPEATLRSTQAGNYFRGGNVAISGNTVVAGSNSPNLTYFPPSFVDVWVEPAAGWRDMTETAQLSDGNTTFADGFGTSTAIVNNVVVVGTPSALDITTGRYYRGAAYLFTKPTGGWQTTATPNGRLVNSDWTKNDGFGSSVAVSGGTLVIGAPFGPNAEDAGEAYVFLK